MFDESCTVTIKVYGEVADKNGSVDAIYMKTDDIGSGNVTVGENATLNIDLKCDQDYQTYGIFAKGNIALNGTVDIKMEYTGSGSTYDTWRDVNVSSATYSSCSIGTNAKITSVSENETYSFSVTENITLTAVYDDIEQSEKTGLSGGAIACIVVGSVALVGIGGFAIFWFVIKKKKVADLIAIFKKK